jgi:hypothetical protein
MERVGALGSRAFGISPSGVIVGDALVRKLGLVSHAAFFKGGEAADLGTLEARCSAAHTGINAC